MKNHMLSRRMLLRTALGGLGWCAIPFECSAQEVPARWSYNITNFEFGDTNGWLPGFSDYSFLTASTNRMALVRRLPEEIDSNRFGYYLQGRNTSDDLFMFLKKPISGLANNRSYDVSFYLEVVSNAPSNCAGIGGPPGESVWIKAGASEREPVAALDGDSIRLSADKGNQSGGGADAVIASDFANGLPCETAMGRSVLLRRTATLSRPVQTDGTGTLWAFVGTDSGFEGTTEIYYAFIAVLLTLRG